MTYLFFARRPLQKELPIKSWKLRKIIAYKFIKFILPISRHISAFFHQFTSKQPNFLKNVEIKKVLLIFVENWVNLNIIYLYLQDFFSKRKRFDGKFFLQWRAGKKNNHKFIIIFSFFNSAKLEVTHSVIFQRIKLLQKFILSMNY